jgi:predicted nucleotide-binding protein (sugar kinase/HSP70/actin superfamily)
MGMDIKFKEKQVEALVYPTLRHFRKRVNVLENSHISPICPSYKSNMQINISTKMQEKSVQYLPSFSIKKTRYFPQCCIYMFNMSYHNQQHLFR